MDIDVEVARGAQFATSTEVIDQCELEAEVDVESFQAKLFVGLVKRANNFNLRALLKYVKAPEEEGEEEAEVLDD